MTAADALPGGAGTAGDDGFREVVPGARLTWFSQAESGTAGRVRLFCIPFAGGGPSAYLEWVRFLPPEIEPFSVNLPGRGSRLHEPPIRRMTELVARLLPDTLDRIERPYAIFGHSMGAHVAWELACQLRDRGAPPLVLFVSSRRAPQLPERNTLPSQLDDAAMLEIAISVYGLDGGIRRDPEVLRVLLPALRADFEIIDSYEWVRRRPLDCPIVAFGGTDDFAVDPSELRAWAELTTSAFSLRLMPGAHFFFHGDRQMLAKLVESSIRSVLP